MNRQLVGQTALALAGTLVITEVLLRAFGVLDFPLWRADPVLGYIPAPSQHGRLFNKADWVFNEHSMGVAAPFKATAGCKIVGGDSLVFSGAKTPQAEKLGPLIEARIHRPVWPIAANSWALENELTYLNTHPDVLACDTVVIVSNSGDYQDPSVWRSELTHPRRYPVLGTLYLFQKALFTPKDTPVDWPTATQEARWSASLDRFLAHYHGRVIFVLYPMKDDLVHHTARFRPFLSRLKGRAEIFDVTPFWRPGDYRDAIHPTAAAEPKLADLIASAIQSPGSLNGLAQSRHDKARPRS